MNYRDMSDTCFLIWRLKNVKIMKIQTTLKHVPNAVLQWQWHAKEFYWNDFITREKTSYLAGFTSKDNAILYGMLKGYEND